MYENKMKRMLENGQVPFGMYAAADSKIFLEILCRSGVDYIIIETEHGPVSPLSYEPLATFCRIARQWGVTPLVRTPSDDPIYVGKSLDAGALGIIVPHFKNRESAERLVASAFFPPIGERGCGPLAAANDYIDPFGEYLMHANDEVIVGGLIEDEEGIECCDEILAVEGISYVMVGTLDLAASMGIESVGADGGASHPKVQAARRKVFDACKRHGVAISMRNFGPEFFEEARESGMRYILGGGTDVGLASAAYRAHVVQERARLES